LGVWLEEGAVVTLVEELVVATHHQVRSGRVEAAEVVGQDMPEAGGIREDLMFTQ
jgi:hypothetical protein